jgi:cytochrome c biogenesis protein CcdA
MVPRGEFSIVVAALASPAVRLAGTAYLLLSMGLGIPFFMIAEFLARKGAPTVQRVEKVKDVLKEKEVIGG